MDVMRNDAETKILLAESEMPRRWYNIVADLPTPPPPVLHPGRLQPVGPAEDRELSDAAIAEAIAALPVVP